MDPSVLFRSSLALIDSAAAAVCRRAGLHGADAEDFASNFKLTLMADDYASLRGYEGRSSLGTYLTVIAHRLLVDEWRAAGRWHASSAALQMNEAGVLLERALRYERRSVDEVLPLLQSLDPSLTREAVVAMEAKLPLRPPRPRIVELEPHAETLAGGERADVLVVASEAQRLAQRAGEAVRRILAELNVEDRSILRLRFAAGLTIADVSRSLRIPQRPLYRRIERLLLRIRRELEGAGFDASAAAELIGGVAEFDFALGTCENEAVRPTNHLSEPMRTKSAT
jgi:RNA polymerase sigma factor (sigma-70 family)